MDTPAIGGSNGGGPISQALAGNRQLGQQEFLKLLITQLTNQDPLSPQDDKEFVAQMAQFSALENQTQMSTTINRLQATAMLGKTVEAQVMGDGRPELYTGIAQSVNLTNGAVKIMVGDREVSMDQVRQIRDR